MPLRSLSKGIEPTKITAEVLKQEAQGLQLFSFQPFTMELLQRRSSSKTPRQSPSFGPNNIFVFHLQGDSYQPTVKSEEITRKPLKVEFAFQLAESCPSV